MRIVKFGGTSVGSPKKINNVIEIVQGIIKEHGRAAVVVSAIEGTTDELQHMASLASRGREEFREILEKLKKVHVTCVNELIPADQRSTVLANVQVLINDLEDALQGVFLVWEISDRILDYILSFGEQLSAYIISAAMTSKGFPAEYLDARKIIRTDDKFGAANVDFEVTNRQIREHFEAHQVTQIMTGFIGATPIGETATLGRGGSDYSSAIVAAALDADAIEIWTDVDGIMTADPRQVRRAFPIEKISYHEAMELSHFGARVIHPPTLQPARARSIPIIVRNSLNPEFPGTYIEEEVEPGKFPATGISAIDNVNLLRVQGSGMVGVAGVSSRLFGALSQHGINVILISQASSEHSICFAVTPGNSNLAKRVIEDEFKLELVARQIDEVVVENNLAIVSVVGDNMCKTPGVAGKIFQTLGRNTINIIAIAQGSTERNISFVVARGDRAKALNVIHDEFFLPTLRSLEVVVVGAGNVGGELIDQMKDQQKSLHEDFGIHLNVVGIANSRKYIFEPRGIVLENWRDHLEEAGTEYDRVDDLIEKTEVLDLSSIVFVDCTASNDLPAKYHHLLESGVSVVTANKKGQTGALESYQSLKKHFKTRGVKFLYEASVGAGLPILSTLRSLLASGDQIVRIEGVVSGTLSYIFNSFTPERSFSEVVQEAQKLGFTEPDPREDLNGMDVARKLLILARECGIDLELEDIALEPLLNDECLNAKSIEEFYEKLKGMDEVFEKKAADAASRGCSLCYRALLEDGKAKVLLSEVDKDHPLSSLSGSDNMFIFQTKRYFSRPLVVRGPGAGGAVTAAGVFADVISTAEKLAIV
jgi:aspartokinase/homoserine dehydrogenase 1